MDRKFISIILSASLLGSLIIYLFLSTGLEITKPINIPNMEMRDWLKLSQNEKFDYFTNSPNGLKSVTGLEKLKFQLTYQANYHFAKFLMLFVSILITSAAVSLATKNYNKCQQ